MHAPDIVFLKDAIRELHACDADPMDSVLVREVLRGRVVWEGVVEVFFLRGHPYAKRAYAWDNREVGERKAQVFFAWKISFNSPECGESISRQLRALDRVKPAASLSH